MTYIDNLLKEPSPTTRVDPEMISVFKTNVASKEQIQEVEQILIKLPGIIDWSFDLEDSDRILRVIQTDPQPDQVVTHLQQKGFSCEELQD